MNTVLTVFFMKFTSGLGDLFAGSIADARGRIFAIGTSYLFILFGFLVVSVAERYLVFSVGLAMAGVGDGVVLTANTMFFTEIAPKELRGQFVALEEIFIILGNVFRFGR